MSAVATNPDGTPALLIPDQGRRLVQDNDVIHVCGKKMMPNPLLAQDEAARKALDEAQRQFNAALAMHNSADKDLHQMVNEDAATFSSHDTFETYSAAAPADDAGVRAAIEATDAAVAAAIAAAAAGPNPVLPSAPGLLPTPGMDWLERMQAEDEALRRAVDNNDVRLKPPQ